MEQRLESFLTLCSTMHYGRAAELLNLSQPAVSKHIQSLENQYGVTLFTYANRRLRKTRQGELMEQYAQSLRYNEEDLLKRLHDDSKTTLRIGGTKSVGEYVLLPYIKKYLQTPENQIDYLVDNTEHLLELLNHGELDFVVVEGLFDKQHYDWMLFQNEPYIGICAAGHRFAGRRVTPEELLGETLLLREPGSGTRSILERELMQVSYSTAAFSRTICISSFPVIRALTAANCGISFLYEAVVRGSPEIGSFTCPPLTGRHELNVVFLQHTGAGSLAREFVAPVMEQFP